MWAVSSGYVSDRPSMILTSRGLIRDSQLTWFGSFCLLMNILGMEETACLVRLNIKVAVVRQTLI